MKISEIARILDGKILSCKAKSDESVSGGYDSDLLSDVMGNAKAGDAWFTMQTHKNIIAVAALRDISCIVITGGNSLEDIALEAAEDEGMPVIATGFSKFEAVGKFYASLMANEKI